LQIGQEYDLTKDFNLPFKAKYSGETRATIKLEIVQPSNLKIGFESIPDTRWIKFSNNEISVLPEGNVYSDIKIKIPDDKTLLGKKFQANIRCYVSSLENSNFISVTPGVEGSFLFSISQDTKKRKVKPIDLNFELEPKEITKTINKTEKFSAEINIKNLTKKSCTFTIKYRNPDEVNIKLRDGYKLLPEEMVLFSSKELLIRSGKEQKFELNIIPEEKILPGKYFCLIEVQVSKKYVVGSKYVKIYLEII